MRTNFNESAAANVRASKVLATPGTPSSRTWPSDRRLTSKSSMAASCPTTTLRSSCFSRSPTERIVSRSMQHLPFPAIELARNPQQMARVGASVGGRKLSLTAQLSRRAVHVARLTDPLQPLIQCSTGKLSGRVDAPCHVRKGHGQIPREDLRRMTAEL